MCSATAMCQFCLFVAKFVYLRFQTKMAMFVKLYKFILRFIFDWTQCSVTVQGRIQGGHRGRDPPKDTEVTFWSTAIILIH